MTFMVHYTVFGYKTLVIEGILQLSGFCSVMHNSNNNINLI